MILLPQPPKGWDYYIISDRSIFSKSLMACVTEVRSFPIVSITSILWCTRSRSGFSVSVMRESRYGSGPLLLGCCRPLVASAGLAGYPETQDSFLTPTVARPTPNTHKELSYERPDNPALNMSMVRSSMFRLCGSAPHSSVALQPLASSFSLSASWSCSVLV